MMHAIHAIVVHYIDELECFYASQPSVSDLRIFLHVHVGESSLPSSDL
jgi:hypothetical protein